MKKTIQLILVSALIFSCKSKPDVNYDYLNSELKVANRVEILLGQMTLEEKIGQMTQVERNHLTLLDITNYNIGSILSGGGSSPTPNNLESWRSMIKAMQDSALRTRLKIPLLYGTDAVHGHSNLKDSVVYPHNINLGAINDPELVRKIGENTARDMRATGANYNFAPCLAVSRDERWGRTYESYSENKEIVSALGEAYVLGQQRGQYPVAATIKHFVGDGSTHKGLDRSYSKISRDELFEIHLYPYIKSIEAGAKSVMISQHSWDNKELHGHEKLIRETLKGELGFKGIVISDWAGIDQLPGDYYEDVVQGINAGIDLIMVPDKFSTFYNYAINAVENGDIPIERVDDAVRRILRVKFELGLFENPYPLDEDFILRDDSSIALAREAVNRSVVVLKNRNALPIKEKSIVVAGKSANDIGNQCGGWTMEWQGKSGNITEGTTIFEGLVEVAPEGVDLKLSSELDDMEKADHILVVVGETPYAEWEGDRTDISLNNWDKGLIDKALSTGKKVSVLLISGRPMVVTDEIERVDSFTSAFLPGTEGGGVADVLFGIVSPTGKLPYSWPKSNQEIPVNFDTDENEALFPIGYGLTY